MTLEKLVTPSAFLESTLIPSSTPQKKSDVTASRLSKYSDSNTDTALISNGMNITGHRGLCRTASDSSFLTRTQLAQLGHITRVSTNLAGYNNEDECSLNTRFLSRVDGKLSQNKSCVNSYANKADSELRYLLLKKQSSTAHMRNISSSGPQTTENATSSRQETSITDNLVLLSGEHLLDFPSNFDSPKSHIVKMTDNITKLKDHPGLHHSASMPGLIGSSIKESRPNFANAKFESRSRPFFFLFRKKQKPSEGKSPSSSVTSNHQKIRKSHSNLSFTPQSQKISQRTASPSSRGRRSAGQSPVSPKFYLNSVSSNIPCTPSSPPSMSTLTETTSNSMSSTEKLPQYIPRSRSNTRRRSRRKSADFEQADPEYHITLEDLPPHPSVLKQSLGKTISNPYTSIITFKSSKYTMRDISKEMSTLRRNSLPESLTNVKMKDANNGRRYIPKDCKFESSQKVRRKSLEINSKSISGTDFYSESMCMSHNDKPMLSIRAPSVPSFTADLYLPGTDTKVISDEEDFEYNPTDMTGRLHLSFSGCGFLGIYHLGVISCLTQRSPSLLLQVEKVAGASAGAIMAALLIACPDNIEHSANHIHILAKEIRKKPLGPLTPGFNFTRSLRSMLNDILPENAHETTQGKLFISVTNSDTKKNEMISDFSSRDELIEVLVSSCYVPVYAGIKPAAIRGKKYIDGGLSNNMPVFETGRTITVSPFGGTSDIGPKAGQEAEKKSHFFHIQNQEIQVSVNNARKSTQAFFPPKRQSLEEYFVKGRYDASRFLIREGLYEISTATQKKVTLYESSV